MNLDLGNRTNEEAEQLRREYIECFKQLNLLVIGSFLKDVEADPREKAVFVNDNLDKIIAKPELLEYFLTMRRSVFEKYKGEVVQLLDKLDAEMGVED